MRTMRVRLMVIEPSRAAEGLSVAMGALVLHEAHVALRVRVERIVTEAPAAQLAPLPHTAGAPVSGEILRHAASEIRDSKGFCLSSLAWLRTCRDDCDRQ
jgi:hypothetical protein